MVVVGGGAIGVELAQAFARFGTRVTLVEAAPHPRRRGARGVRRRGRARWPRTASRCWPGRRSARCATPRAVHGRGDRRRGDALELAADRLLVAAGRRPNLTDIGLDTVGLDPSARSVETDERMRAGDRLWAIGDITGKGAFTHVSMYQADVALRDVLGRDGPRPSTTRCRG